MSIMSIIGSFMFGVGVGFIITMAIALLWVICGF